MPSVKNIWFNTFRKRIDKRTVKELIKASGQQIIFPFYHVVSNDDLPHIKHLYSYRNVAAFERDMDFLMRHFTPLHYDDLLSGRYQPNTPYVHLSFDDGLSEMYHIVRPILLEKGIPATFFINSAFVNDQGLMYRYKVSLLLEHVPAEALKKAIVFGEERKNVQVSDPKRFLLQLDARQEQWINDIAVAAGFDFSAFLQTNKPYMDLEQIMQLQRDGFTIGAHSVDHPAFASIAPVSQAEQVKQSVQYVRDTCGVKNPAFAFPFTAVGADPKLFDTMYAEFGVSRSFGTGGMQKQKYPNHIDRIPAEYRDWPLESVVKAEYHYFLAKKLVGK